MNCKLLLFDLDGTLLQTDKAISKQTMGRTLYEKYGFVKMEDEMELI